MSRVLCSGVLFPVVVLLSAVQAGAGDSIWVAHVELRPSLPGEPLPLCVQPQQWYTLEVLRECWHRDSSALLRWIQGQGYWFARVHRWWDSEQAIVRYEVEPGELVQIGAVQVSSAPEGSAPALVGALERMSEQVVGCAASEGILGALLDSLVYRLASAGYPRARADISRVQLVGAQAAVFVTVWPGEVARADTVLFVGVKQTRWNFLRRWAGVGPGDTLTDAVLQQAQRRLESLPWLEVVAPPRRERLPGNRWGAVFTLREQTATSLEGLLGYAPPLHGYGGWSGLLRAQLRNLFGTGRRLSVHWYRTLSLQELALQYEEPIPPLLLRGSFEMRQRDTAYTESLWECGLRWLGHIAARWQAELFGGWHRLQPSGVAASIPPSFAVHVGGFGSFGTLQPWGNPVEGVLLSGHLLYRWRSSESVLRHRVAVNGDGELFHRLSPSVVVRLYGHARLVWGQMVRPEEFYRLGGMQSFRGYREAEFWTPRALWGGIEGRWLLGAREYIGLFLDQGWMAGLGWRAGAGVQWQVRTAVGMLQLLFGWGLSNALRHAVVGVRLLSS